MLTYNGWPLALTSEVTTIDAGGCVARVRGGAVAVVLAAFARDFHREVESIATLYGHRSVAANAAAGGDPRSDHLSGTALDINGGHHPWEKRTGTRRYPARGGFTLAQLAALRRLQARYPVAWGGDYRTGYRDAMHHYVHGTPAQIEAAAARITAPPAPTPAPAPAAAPTRRREQLVYVVVARQLNAQGTHDYYLVGPAGVTHVPDTNQLFPMQTIYGPAVPLDRAQITNLDEGLRAHAKGTGLLG